MSDKINSDIIQVNAKVPIVPHYALNPSLDSVLEVLLDIAQLNRVDCDHQFQLVDFMKQIFPLGKYFLVGNCYKRL